MYIFHRVDWREMFVGASEVASYIAASRYDVVAGLGQSGACRQGGGGRRVATGYAEERLRCFQQQIVLTGDEYV